MNIVLVHGILGFGHIGPINYFNGVADHLRTRFQANVHVPVLDPTAGTAVRSAMLRKSIEVALSQGGLAPALPIHLIAHSMGGLDARRMISQQATIQAGTSTVLVKTLATIGTPHRGSPVADVVAGEYVPKLPVLEPVLAAAKIGLGNVLEQFHISLDGLHDLTSRAAAEFNKQFPDHPDVRYLSCAGRGRDRPGLLTSIFFFVDHEFMTICEGDSSDGVVGVSSAKWTGFDPDLWPADHADEIGHNLDDPLQPMTPAIRDRYEALAARF